MAMMIRVCELCGEEEAAFYCRSDVAFLCCKCDARVHEMNFLSARHVRQPICRGCKEIMTGDYISGSGLRNGVWFALCNSCSAQRQDDGETSLSSSSSCISSTNCSSHEKLRMGSNKPDLVTKPRKKVVGARVRALFESWCRKIGVADIEVVVAVASRIFVAAWDGSATGLWFAASLWLSLRVRRMASFEKMRRLVEVSGVPERMISVAQARIAGRMLKDRKILRGGGDVVEEGWAESC
ncbi:hypothetical protein QQ045_024947 [Rhodiola kirilowii]